MAQASRDENNVTTLLGASSVDGVTPVRVYADPVTHRLLVDIPGGAGDVVGPASSTDNAVARFDGTTGKLIQNSGVIVDDSNNMTGVAFLSASGYIHTGTGLTLEDPGAGTNNVTIQAPTLSAGYTLTLPVDDGNPSQFLQTNGSGVLTWAPGGAPGGSTTQLQYNNAGAFGGISGATTDGTIVTFASGDLKFAGASTGSTTLNAASTASGVLTLPAATDTLVGKATTDTFTNKTYDTAGTGNSFSINGVAVTANTGTGAVARATSPSFTTPILGTPTSGNLANCTGYPVASIANLGTGIATFLTTPSSANLAAAITDETGSGSLVFATSPTLVTPTLGAALATSINGLTITTTTGVLTMTNAKTLAVTNTLTLSGTDATIMTFPSTSQTIVGLTATQTLTSKTLTAPAITTVAETGIGTADLLASNNHAISVTTNAGSASQSFMLNTFTNSSAAAMTITIPVSTPTPKDGQFMEVRIYDFSAVAEGITWVNTENSSVTAPTTSNGSTTLPLSVLFQFNNATTKWRCIAFA